jgi:SAM-dependent methyltransferase
MEYIDWIIRQLDLQPHQHMLEVGCGSGRLLAAVSGRFCNSFVAGIEPSLALYRRALRRNAVYLRQEIMQLHLGQVCDLPYPASYFHTIYGSTSYYSWNNLNTECLRLGSLLRTGGRLLLFSHPGHHRQDDDLRTDAARLQAAFLKAGLTDIHTEYQSPGGLRVAVTGFKSTQYFDNQSIISINNRLLNSEASALRPPPSSAITNSPDMVTTTIRHGMVTFGTGSIMNTIAPSSCAATRASVADFAEEGDRLHRT